QAEDGIRDFHVTGVQTCALPIWVHACSRACSPSSLDLAYSLMSSSRRRYASSPHSGSRRAALRTRCREAQADQIAVDVRDDAGHAAVVEPVTVTLVLDGGRPGHPPHQVRGAVEVRPGADPQV